MAMARQMGRPSSPPFALIITVVVAVVFGALAILAYVQWTKEIEERKAAMDAEQQAKKKVTQVEQELKNLKALLSVQTAQDGALQIAEVDEVLSGIARDPEETGGADTAVNTFKNFKLLDVVKELATQRNNQYDAVKSLRAERASLSTQLKDKQTQLGELRGTLDQFQADEQKKTAKIAADFKSTLTTLENKNNNLTSQVEAAEQRVVQVKIQFDDYKRETEETISGLKNKILELEGQLREHNPQLVDKAKWSTSRLVDGSVLQVYPERKTVYLRLRDTSKARLGMRLAVNGAGEEMPAGGKGKAVVEITSLENRSEGKIIESTPGDPILVGDSAYNLVVGPTIYNFVVYGEFDLDNNGVFEPNGQYQIKQLVGKWGGNIQDDIDIKTNFVVLGEAPSVPPQKPPLDADPAVRAAYERAVERRTQWTKINDTAKQYTIPILNEETFLTWIGYYPGSNSNRPGENFFQP